MLNNLQSIAQVNHYQLLDSPETDPAQYISNHPWIERLSKRFGVDVSYPKTWLAHSRLTRTIQPCMSSLRNDVEAILGSTLLSRLIVSDFTPHACSRADLATLPLITHIWSHSRDTFERCIPTLCHPWTINFAPFEAYVLPSSMLWICGCQHTQCIIFQTLNFLVQARLIPLGPS